jgi:hypothetical protein
VRVEQDIFEHRRKIAMLVVRLDKAGRRLATTWAHHQDGRNNVIGAVVSLP